MTLMFLSTSAYQPIVLFLVSVILIISVKKNKLTIPAAFTAILIGVLVLQSAEIKGVSMLMTFFLLSVLATGHKKQFKRQLSRGNMTDSARNSGQVLANGGVAGITAILIISDPLHTALYLIMMAASLASALADTLSSELGMVYGKRFYNILTLKREANGLDGVVSIEGLLIGLAGSAVIALIYSGFGKTALIVLVAGTIGNLTDSVLGAKLERKHYLGNNAVNFLNTLVAAIVAGVLFYFMI